MQNASRWRTRVAVCVGVVVVPACSLLRDWDQYGALTPVDDASSDVAAEADVTADAGDAGQNFCTGATFCDDFEREPSALQGSWGELVGDGLAIERAGGNPDGGQFLRLTRAPSDVTPSVLRKQLAEWGKIRLEFAIRAFTLTNRVVQIDLLEFRTPSGGTDSLFIVLDLPSGAARIQLAEQSLAADGGSNFFRAIGADNMPLGRWIPAAVEIDQRTTPALLTVSFNRVLIFDHAPISIRPQGIPAIVVAGSESASVLDAGPSATVDIDSVRVDVEP